MRVKRIHRKTKAVHLQTLPLEKKRRRKEKGNGENVKHEDLGLAMLNKDGISKEKKEKRSR